MISRVAACLVLLTAVTPIVPVGGVMAATPHQLPIQPPPLMLTPPALCEAAIAGAEVQQKLPERVLHAIALRESGRPDPETGHIRPWPWTINFEGAGHYYDSKEEAIAAVRQIQAAGGQSIDVGCMQVNLMHHPNAFATLEEAFDPIGNAAYAGRFLHSLFASAGDWGVAIASYHSRTPGVGEPYRDQVLAAWNPSDPSVLARLSTSPIPMPPFFPVALFPSVSTSSSPVWASVPAGPAVPSRAFWQRGGAYRAFPPMNAVYADFSPKSGRPKIRPLDLRVGSGLTAAAGGLVVPKGVAVPKTSASAKAAVTKPAATRPGQAG